MYQNIEESTKINLDGNIAEIKLSDGFDKKMIAFHLIMAFSRILQE